MNLHGILLLPAEAARQAFHVDRLFYSIVAASALVSLLVVALIVGFSVRFRAGSRVKRKPLPEFLTREVEITWTLATLFVFLGLFWWSSTLSLIHIRPPPHSLKIRVVAKQWMWKIEQPSGVREIDTVHMPIDTPVLLLMTSQDVIHSFYVPAFRAKQDVLPDRVTKLWFTPDKLGTFSLKCAEYCGTYHSEMKGRIVVMSKADYARWTARRKSDSLAQRGAVDFRRAGCASCHTAVTTAKAPSLHHIYGKRVPLTNGLTRVVNGFYIARAIRDPSADIVTGYSNTMPAYPALDAGQISALAAYVKSLSRNTQRSP